MYMQPSCMLLKLACFNTTIGWFQDYGMFKNMDVLHKVWWGSNENLLKPFNISLLRVPQSLQLPLSENTLSPP